MKRIICITLLILSEVSAIAQDKNCSQKHEPFWSVPKELNRKRYKPQGMLYGHPYTLIDRRKYLNANDAFIEIRNSLQNESIIFDPLRTLYRTIYDNAIKIRPASGGKWAPEVSELPLWAKYNAFIFLIGLDPTNNFQPIDSPTNVSNWYVKRQEFANRAMEAFEYMEYEIPHPSILEGLEEPVKRTLYRSRELIMWCQAYDLLKAAYVLPELHVLIPKNQTQTMPRYPLPPYDGDRNKGWCSPRNQLRLLARNFYLTADDPAGPVRSLTGWKKNHGIACAAAIGMASVVLNDAGVETNYIKALFDWIRPAPNYSPNNWAELAGRYRENLLDGWHIWPFENTPQTNATGSSGYAEGPGYFNYTMSCLIPYLRAFDNLTAYRNTSALETEPMTGMFKWAEEIASDGGSLPSYDNSAYNVQSILGLLGPDKYVFSTYDMSNLGLAVDYIAIMALTKPENGDTVILRNESGNLILKRTAGGKKHYLQMLCEEGSAVDKEASIVDGTHEDTDFGSFSLYAGGSTSLIIDPPYFGWGSENRTNGFDKHNGIEISSIDSRDALSVENTRSTYHGFSLEYKSSGRRISSPSSITASAIERKVTSFVSPGDRLYYILNDKISAFHESYTSDFVEWRLNGNGDVNVGTYVYEPFGKEHVSVWTNPCPNWKITHHYTVLDGMNKPVTQSFINSDNKDVTPTYQHTRITLKQYKPFTLIQSFLYPSSCADSTPLITRNEEADYVTTTIRFLTPIDTTVVHRNMYKNASASYKDTIADFHLARYDGGTSSVTNPFELSGSSASIQSDALNIFMSRSTYSKPGSGACASSKVHFNKASVSNGTYLTYDDTTYIFAGVPLDAHYEIIDKFKYEGYIDPLGGSATVRFYLPDAEPGYEMKATGKYVIGQNYYADSFKIDVTVSQPGEFIIELADPCQADCFFPPNTAPIDSLFVFETGTTEVLGHDLDIVQDKGEMHITKGSKMSICEQFVFANKDSLLLSNVEGNEVFPVTNIMDGPGTVTNRVVARLMSKRSMIIVNNKAALVLDSGSFTHVGDNSTILIRKGGTLLVRRGAILEIGGNEGSGQFAFGEVIAEEGSYVCIEDGSDIHFFADTGWVDTLDNNIFFVNLNAYLPAVAGVNTLGGRGKFAGDSIYGGSECRAFCDVKIYHPPHGVNNREYGWCNFSEPVSMFYMRDTMCEYEQPVIKGKRSLNETWHRAEMRHNGSLLYSKESHPDSARVDEIKMPAFPEPGAYSFTLITRNDCAETDTLVRNVIVPDSAYAVFTLSDTSICNGTGNLTVNGTASVSNLSTVKHLWFVQRIDTVGGDSLSPVFTTEDYSQEWLFDKAAVDSNFSFPDFYWQGGHRYAVGLTVFGFCNDSTYTDTINVPLSAGISVAARPGVFSDPLGPSALQLNAWVRGASSWGWSPTTGLFPSNSLTPLATPDNDVTYVLTAVNGSCTAKDSVIIKRTHFTYAGDSRTICDGEGTVLGSRYVLATILAMSGGAHYAELEQLAAFDQKRLSALLMEHHVIDFDDIGACASLSYLSPEQSDFTEKMLNYPGFSTYFSAYMGPHDVNVHYDFYNELMLDPYFSSVLSQVDNDACFGDFLQDLITLYTNCGNYNMVNDVSKTSAFILGAMYAADSSSFGEIWEELNEGDLHFPSYLDGFIQSAEFASIPCLSITELPLSYDEQTLLGDPSFMIYYDSLISDPRSKNAFQLFVDQYIGNHGSDVADDILADAEGYVTCFEMLKVNYIEWLNNQDPSCVSKRLVTWEKMETGSNWLHLRNWNDHYNIIDTPHVKTDYRITVIDIANNIVEHDIVTISIDTAPVPLFYPTYQTDSTLYFTNYTASANSISYEWTFGDGSPATHSTHAIHTFPAMDSSYLVCLKATNACGSYSTCDTFTVDTNGVLLYGGMGKKGRDVVRFEEPAVTEKAQQLPDQHMLSFNRPNPFGEITSIDYAVKQPYHSVSMRVTNTLGQLMYDVSLPALKGTVLFDASEMRSGMYYYSLVVDGVAVKTHTMVVDR